MHLAHLGVAMFVVGVALVKGYPAERDVRMMPGEHVSVSGYTFTFNGTEEVRGPNYTATRGDFIVTKDGKVMVNEINTMPGFTSISMYPKAWEATGVRYTDLITMLIEGVLR